MGATGSGLVTAVKSTGWLLFSLRGFFVGGGAAALCLGGFRGAGVGMLARASELSLGMCRGLVAG